MNSTRISSSLFPVVVFGLATLGAVRADDLLDSVLSEKPSVAPVAQPAQEAAKTEKSATKPQTDGRLLDAVLSVPAAQVRETVVNDTAAKDASQDATAALAAAKNAADGDARLALSGLMASDVDLKSGSVAGETTKKNSTFLMRGGVGIVDNDNADSDSSLALSADIERRFQIWDSPFDISFRGFALHQEEEGVGSYQETYYTYWYSWYSGLHSYKHTRTIYYDWEWSETRAGAEAMLLFVPWRGTVLEPFAGVGVRGEYLVEDWTDDGDSYDTDESGVCFSYRVGLKINLGHAFLSGEYIAGGDIGDYDGTKELIGSLGVRLRSGLLLQLNIESVEFDSYSRGYAFGGGAGFCF